MKYADVRPFADPEKAARIANTTEAVQDGRIHIEKLNGPFLYQGRRQPCRIRRRH
jgi:hypothetical protein